MSQQELIPEWKIKLNGSDLSHEIVSDVLGVEVEQHINGADTFDITLSAWDAVSQELKWIDDGSFAEGSELEVLAGYGEELESLIVGEVVALQINYSAENPPVLQVEGHDKLHRFRRGRKSQTFVDIKDSELAIQIAQEMQLQTNVEDSEIVHRHLFQFNQSNIDFLQERARRIHYELDILDGVLNFRKAPYHQGKTINLNYREDLKNFNVRVSTLSQVKKVVVKGWNTTSKETIVGLGQIGDEAGMMGGSNLGVSLAENAFGEFEEVIIDKPVFDQAEADQIAKAVFNRMNLEYIKADGECIGNAKVKAGEVLEIDRLGRRLSGLYYLAMVHHIIDSDGYVTRFTCQRNATS